jgi:chemotaxis protein MotB
MAKNDKHPIIIKRGGGDDLEHDEGGHGGAWKIAYADFMTAMMSFFLVMWLLNATTDEQRKGIAQFFNPMAERDTHSQATDTMLDIQPSPLTGGTSVRRIRDGDSLDTARHGEPGRQDAPQVSSQGAAADHMPLGIPTQFTPLPPAVVPIGGEGTGTATKAGYIGGESPVDAAAEQAQIEQMATGLQKAIQANPDLQGAAANVSVQIGRDDIRIALRDSNNTPMFDSGSAAPNSLGKQMLAMIASWLAPMPEHISIVGYTDGAPYHVSKKWSMSNWTLSVLRADHAREVLVQSGYPDRNILDVLGRADRDLVVSSDPANAGNRRVVLVMHRRFVSPADTPAPGAAAGHDVPDTPVLPGGTAGKGTPG